MLISACQRFIELKNRHFLMLDAIAFSIAPLLALVIRLDGDFSLQGYSSALIAVTILFLVVKLTVFYVFGVYKRYWRYANIDDLVQMTALTAAAVALQTLLFYALDWWSSLPTSHLPLSLPLLDGMLCFLYASSLRFSVPTVERFIQQQLRFYGRDSLTPRANAKGFAALTLRLRDFLTPRANAKGFGALTLRLQDSRDVVCNVSTASREASREAYAQKAVRVLVVGAGSAGAFLVQEMQRNPQIDFYPVAFIDDDPQKLNLHICSIPVVGNRHKIPETVRSLQIGRVIIAMPSVPGSVIREIATICQKIGIKTSTLPGLNEILKGRIRVGDIRDIQIEDLLRREAIEIDIQSISRFLAGKKVLITGAGGSIGSELCRLVFKCRPAKMLLLGHGENSVFNIQQELEEVLRLLKNNGEAGVNDPEIITAIADIRFSSRLNYIFEQFKPDIVFHAAAHKHVPLMEMNSPEAIANNVLGTKNLLDMALQYNIQHFVMISTDKAVNPTNVMGATKRVCEMLVLQAAQKSGKSFVVVRFGNVLGSRGSVVPTFRRQIAAGGPITITHPDICRYFMTIPEAVQLVLQASVMGRGGEVFMLDMGQPVKIANLAEDLIRLSGYEVGKDIDIVFTGLRPGEKLFEELFVPGEQYKPTQHEKILTVENASKFITQNLNSIVEALLTAADKNDRHSIISLLKQLVPEYKPNSANKMPENQLENNAEAATRNGARSQLENDLRLALERQEFRLYYQPIMSLEDNRIIGFEALLRWQHPDRGLISPAEFVPVAEETNSIVPIGKWVLGEACRQMRSWQKQFPALSDLTMSVVLSGKQLLLPDLNEQIEQILQETGLKARNLKLEIPESAIAVSAESTTAILLKLKTLGVQLQVDDFGTGDSLLNCLHSWPINTLKIDCSLADKMNVNERSLQSAWKILNLARNLGIEAIAGKMETAEQLVQFKDLNCKYGQGYFFSKPIACEAAETLMAAHPLSNVSKSLLSKINKPILLSTPHMGDRELEFVKEAFETNWIAPIGPHVDAFEREFCQVVGAENAAAVNSGTAALHLALQLAGVEAGDEVFCSTLTFIATASPIIFLGAKPVFIDSDRATWNMNPDLLREALEIRARQGKLPKAVVLVHLYGQSADIDPILEACANYDIPVIEDAAESLGATYKGRSPGTLGKIGIYSFNGNKIITCSGGGMLVSEDEKLMAKARFLATQARDPAPHYQHSEIGYNYRLSNILAGIGRGQLLVLNDRVAARRRNFEVYQQGLENVPGIEFMPEADFGRGTRWLSCLTVDSAAFGADAEKIRVTLAKQQIEVRPVWKPLHLQPVFAECECFGGAIAEDLFKRGLCLPSGSNLTVEDLERVFGAITKIHRHNRVKTPVSINSRVNVRTRNVNAR